MLQGGVINQYGNSYIIKGSVRAYALEDLPWKQFLKHSQWSNHQN